MCRSTRLLRIEAELAEHEAIRAAALPYVRKMSGVRKPSQAQLTAFEAAIDEIAMGSSDLLASLGAKAATPA